MFELERECELVVAPLHSVQLAAEGTESEGIWEAAVADFAGEGDALPRSGLGALIQEDNLGAVDDVCLNAGDVDVSLDLVHPNHVVVRGSPNLNEAMILVVDGAVVAQGIAHAVQAEEVALALIGIHMNLARSEVISSQQRFQPWRPKILTPHSHKRAHHDGVSY